MCARSTSVIHVTRLGWGMLAALVIAPWAIMTILLRRERPAAPRDAPITAKATTTAAWEALSNESARGAWGELDRVRILIEPPEEFIPIEFGDLATRWVFEGYTADMLDRLWVEAGLEQSQRVSLNALARAPGAGLDRIVLQPDVAIVTGLSPTARARIYSVLAAFPENPSQRDPFRFRADAIDDWFRDSGVSPEAIAQTRRLLYPRGPSVHLSDAHLVLATLPAAERGPYIKTLARKSALLVKLIVRQDSDINAMARYWGQAGRAKDVRPLLQSLARAPGGAKIDIAHLLPGFARSLLYTYPTPTTSSADRSLDCHWTSFNFFNERPDERFADINLVKKSLLEEYYPVAGEPALGDILILMRDDGVVVHSCVYLADSIVFTKNGAAFSVPWVLARQEDVVAFYTLGDRPPEVRRYRSKQR